MAAQQQRDVLPRRGYRDWLVRPGDVLPERAPFLEEHTVDDLVHRQFIICDENLEAAPRARREPTAEASPHGRPPSQMSTGADSPVDDTASACAQCRYKPIHSHGDDG